MQQSTIPGCGEGVTSLKRRVCLFVTTGAPTSIKQVHTLGKWVISELGQKGLSILSLITATFIHLRKLEALNEEAFGWCILSGDRKLRARCLYSSSQASVGESCRLRGFPKTSSVCIVLTWIHSNDPLLLWLATTDPQTKTWSANCKRHNLHVGFFHGASTAARTRTHGSWILFPPSEHAGLGLCSSAWRLVEMCA